MPLTMHLLRRAHHFEYRNSLGLDELGTVDVWSDVSGQRIVLVLKNMPPGDAPSALNTLQHTWLPYLLLPEAQIVTLALKPVRDGEKARALVLPHSA